MTFLFSSDEASCSGNICLRSIDIRQPNTELVEFPDSEDENHEEEPAEEEFVSALEFDKIKEIVLDLKNKQLKNELMQKEPQQNIKEESTEK